MCFQIFQRRYFSWCLGMAGRGDFDYFERIKAGLRDLKLAAEDVFSWDDPTKCVVCERQLRDAPTYQRFCTERCLYNFWADVKQEYLKTSGIVSTIAKQNSMTFYLLSPVLSLHRANNVIAIPISVSVLQVTMTPRQGLLAHLCFIDFSLRHLLKVL